MAEASYSSQHEHLIYTPRLDIAMISAEEMNALIAGDADAVSGSSSGLDLRPLLPRDPDMLDLLRLRRDQVRANPSWAPWSLRAIVLRETGAVIGHANFHGPPGVNDTSTPGAAEIGYELFPAFRNAGYATELARAMIEWARNHGVTHFISGVQPDNGASLRVNEKLGFRLTGQVVEGELIFEMNVP